MTASVLLALDLLAGLGAVVMLAAAAALAAGATAAPAAAAPRAAAPARSLLGQVLAIGGLVMVLLRLVLVAALAPHGWAFVADRVLLGLPLALGTAALAVPALLRRAAPRRNRPPGDGALGEPARVLVAAACGSAGALAVPFVVGYPLSWIPAAMVVVVVVATVVVVLPGRVPRPDRRRRAAAVGMAATSALLLGTGWAWTADVAGHGTHAVAHGGPATPGPLRDAAAISVADLRTPVTAAAGRTVRRVEVEAGQEQVRLPSGTSVDAWTYGALPGPLLEATQGDLVEVTLRNRDVPPGVTIHWHGYDVPNGEDGVAGVTQDAVPPGGTFTYRFVAHDAGTYWYHTHQRSSEGVRRGLYGVLVVHPLDQERPDVDLVLPVHTIAGTPTLGGSDVVETQDVAAGATVRLRLVNADQVPRRVSVDERAARVVAIDGRSLLGPTPLDGRVLRLAAGARMDVELTMPARPVEVAVDGAAAVGRVLVPAPTTRPGPAGPPASLAFRPGPELDPLAYGTPAEPGPAEAVDVEHVLVLDDLLRFVHGTPRLAPTVNGRVWPHAPPIEVTEGQLLRLVVVNRSAQTHPMHVHGHHVRVVSRDGSPARGSPLWLDTVDVRPGEIWEVVLRADNPGVWMAHCHNLDHAALGMVLHLAYRGVSSPFEMSGETANVPE